MLAVIQKSNQVSSLQGQLIATQDRSLRAERRSDELEAPDRDAQSAGAATESGIRGSRGGCHTPQLQFEIREDEPIRSGEDRIQGGRIDNECEVRSEKTGSRSANSGRRRLYHPGRRRLVSTGLDDSPYPRRRLATPAPEFRHRRKHPPPHPRVCDRQHFRSCPGDW